jgi:hypothetical protein
MRNSSDKNWRENQNTPCSATCISESRAVYEIMYKNKVQQDMPQMTIKYGACDLRDGYLRLQTHTQNM